MNPVLFRLRIAYAKQERGRYLSHLEVQRALTRLVRRSGLPFAVSQGFNPHMRLATGPALSVGVASMREYFDLTLTRYIKPTDALSCLKAAAPEVLPILAVRYVNDKEASLSAALTWQRICAKIEPVPLGLTAQRLEAGLVAVRACGTLEVEHKGKIKFFNPAECIGNEATVTEEGQALSIVFDLRISPSGSLRPDALLKAVLRETKDTEPLSSCQVGLTRVGLFIEDDDGTWHTPL